MEIKVDANQFTTQIATLDSVVSSSDVAAIDISISKTTVSSIQQFSDIAGRLHQGLTSVQGVVKKLSTNASGAKNAVVIMDMQIDQEVSKAMDMSITNGGE